MTEIRSKDLCKRITVRFCAPEYATAFEVRNATGHVHQARYCDAIAFSLFPSRGLTIHGMEIKVSRTDWVKELKTPHKAESIARHCDYWSLVVSEPDIVKEGELPPTWGLMVPEPKGSGLKTIKAPKELQTGDAAMDRTLDRGFVFSLMRNFTEHTVPKRLVDQKVSEAMNGSRDWRIDNAERGEKNARDASEKLQKLITDFEAATGISIRVGQCQVDAHYKVVRELMWMLKELGPEQIMKKYEHAVYDLSRLNKEIEVRMQNLREVMAREGAPATATVLPQISMEKETGI